MPEFNAEEFYLSVLQQDSCEPSCEVVDEAFKTTFAALPAEERAAAADALTGGPRPPAPNCRLSRP